MENRSLLFVEGLRPARPLDREAPFLEELKVSQAIEVGRFLLGMPRVNLLLIGLNDGVWPLLKSAVLDLNEPITTWRPGEILVLPAVAGTLVLHDVNAMLPGDQRRLLEWLKFSSGSVRVISTASAHLVPMLEAGTFNDALYYRLNTLCVDLAE